MSLLSEFCDDLKGVQPGEQATLSYDGCIWLLGEIARLQNVAKKAVEGERDALKKVKATTKEE